ncbi:MAG: CGP-CTERM sorting domain-containing protein [Thermococci archaeon]|nr:CGP-CTERM sorting domain-containing protein [Thermococci archaeon]
MLGSVKRFVGFVVLVLIVLSVPVVGFSVNRPSFQTNLFPLSRGLRMVSYPFPECGEVLSLSQFPLYVWVNATHMVAITGKVLVNCPVSGLNGTYVPVRVGDGAPPSFNGTLNYTMFMRVKVYSNRTVLYKWFTRNVTINGTVYHTLSAKKVNGTLTVINVTLVTPDQEYRPVELMTNNATVTYLPYNSTYELVVLNFTNLTMGTDSPYIWKDYAGGGNGTVSPKLFGWPVNMTIKILINKRTGAGYLLDNGTRKYIGSMTPFWYPDVKPKRFVRIVLNNTRELVNELKANPWVVETVLEKAKLANVQEESKLINSLAIKLVDRILLPKALYLGRPMYIASSFYALHGVRLPYVNETLNGTYCFVKFSMPVNTPYVLKASWISYYDPSEVNGTPLSDYLNETLSEFLRTGNKSLIAKLISQVIYKANGYLPAMADYTGRTWFVIDSTLPLDVNQTLLFVVPLPGKYAEEFNVPYLMVEMGTTDRFHVRYDPSFFTPVTIFKDWGRIGTCRAALGNELFKRFVHILNSEVYSGFNITDFDGIYPLVKNELSLCGFNVSALNSTTTTKTSTSRAGIVSSSAANGSQTKTGTSAGTQTSTTHSKESRHICGPALILTLTLTPLLRRLKK